MNPNRSRRTLKLTSIYLAGATTWACGAPAATECAQTATCSPIPVSDGGQAGSSATAESGAVTMDAGTTAIGPDAAVTDAPTAEAAAASEPDAGNAQGCQIDGDCALGKVCSSHVCVAGCSDKHGCQAEQACCDGQCFDTKADVKHCGGCSACAVANASAVCASGMCGVATCSQGFVDCDGKAANGCELAKPVGPSIPNPTRPVAGDYTGSFRADPSVSTLRPTFKWTVSTPDTCGAVSYQIQLDEFLQAGRDPIMRVRKPRSRHHGQHEFISTRDRSCRAEDPTGGCALLLARPRVDAAKVCSSWSTVRYVDVGRLRDDLNGDGYSDLLVRGGSDNLYVYFGGTTPSPQPASHGMPGNFFAFGGDLDGDGYGDLLVADPSAVQNGGSFGAVLVYRGKPSWGYDLGTHETIFHTADGLYGFPSEVSAAGDLDGDGRADIMASLASQNAVSIYLNVAGRYADSLVSGRQRQRAPRCGRLRSCGGRQW